MTTFLCYRQIYRSKYNKWHACDWLKLMKSLLNMIHDELKSKSNPDHWELAIRTCGCSCMAITAKKALLQPMLAKSFGVQLNWVNRSNSNSMSHRPPPDFSRFVRWPGCLHTRCMPPYLIALSRLALSLMMPPHHQHCTLIDLPSITAKFSDQRMQDHAPEYQLYGIKIKLHIN
jgi:hypothetical protein